MRKTLYFLCFCLLASFAGAALAQTSVCLIIDEETIDNGISTIDQAAPSHGVDPDFLINDDMPTEVGNPPLRWNTLFPGDEILLPSGEDGDEGWFALPETIAYADDRTTELTDEEWIAAFKAGTLPQDELDKVLDVMPLRNPELMELLGKCASAIVYDSDISSNYDPDYGNLQGARYGTFTFEVIAVVAPGSIPESESSSSFNDLLLRVVSSCPECGDGTLDPGEACDDGNVVAGDGCSATCQDEVCGNGVLDPGEACDDGNTTGGDGCSADCSSDETCGNGTVDPGEACDDGNLVNGDGCDDMCMIEGGGVCGNGMVETGEECDDSNTTGGDGCSATCQNEPTPGACPCNIEPNPAVPFPPVWNNSLGQDQWTSLVGSPANLRIPAVPFIPAAYVPPSVVPDSCTDSGGTVSLQRGTGAGDPNFRRITVNATTCTGEVGGGVYSYVYSVLTPAESAACKALINNRWEDVGGTPSGLADSCDY